MQSARKRHLIHSWKALPHAVLEDTISYYTRKHHLRGIVLHNIGRYQPHSVLKYVSLAEDRKVQTLYNTINSQEISISLLSDIHEKFLVGSQPLIDCSQNHGVILPCRTYVSKSVGSGPRNVEVKVRSQESEDQRDQIRKPNQEVLLGQ